MLNSCTQKVSYYWHSNGGIKSGLRVNIYPHTSTSLFDADQFSSNGDQIAFFRLIRSVGIREVYVATRLFHDTTDGIATASNDVRMVRVTHFHLQRHSVTLLLTQREIVKSHIKFIVITLKHIISKADFNELQRFRVHTPNLLPHFNIISLNTRGPRERRV